MALYEKDEKVISSEVVQYIFALLLGIEVGDERLFQIGYTGYSPDFNKFRIVVVPSSFFSTNVYGTPSSLPNFPLKKWHNLPLLYGNAEEKSVDGVRIINADIVASTYFLISRYEEMVNHVPRDVHGRFPSRESVSYRGGFLHKPLVQQYGEVLRQIAQECGIEVGEYKAKLSKIYLTHDVDMLAHYRNWRSFGGAVLRCWKNPRTTLQAIKSRFGGLRYDPWFTFPFLFSQAEKVKKKYPQKMVETILFIKSGKGQKSYDKPTQYIKKSDYRDFFRYCRGWCVSFGVHLSYESSEDRSLINKEITDLKNVIGSEINRNRNHFLRSRTPADFEELIKQGISEDFTMGYAEEIGFRLGTCQPVRWINPRNQQLTNLVLHPLLVMDNSLNDDRYMGLKYKQALAHIGALIEVTQHYDGELVFLWHNNSVEKNANSYHRELYKTITENLL